MPEEVVIDLPSGQRTLLIKGSRYVCDVSDLASYQALAAFNEDRMAGKLLPTDPETLLPACEKTIDAVLGNNAYLSLFGPHCKNLEPFQLVLKLVILFDEEFLAEDRARAEANKQAMIADLRDYEEGLNRLHKTLEAANAYGINMDRPAKPARNRRRRR